MLLGVDKNTAVLFPLCHFKMSKCTFIQYALSDITRDDLWNVTTTVNVKLAENVLAFISWINKI